MATLDDILTAQKNGVVAINNLNQTTAKIAGTATAATVAASTVAVSGVGRLVSFSVTVAGSSAGMVHDASVVASAAATNALAAVPNVLGVYQVGARFSRGLTIVPGTGQSLNVTYSLD